MNINYSIIPINEVTDTQKETLYNLMCKNYDNMNWQRFLNDFNEKNLVILIKDKGDFLCGFSTYMTKTQKIDNKMYSFLYAGDTIIEKSNWGSLALYRGFARVIKQCLLTQAQNFYFILLSKGMRTYLLLPILFKEFFPRYDRTTPKKLQNLLCTFTHMKFGTQFKKEKGIIHYSIPRDRLKNELAVIPKHKLSNPHVKYFLKKNPDYTIGDELVCIVHLREDNISQLFKKFF